MAAGSCLYPEEAHVTDTYNRSMSTLLSRMHLHCLLPTVKVVLPVSVTFRESTQDQLMTWLPEVLMTAVDDEYMEIAPVVVLTMKSVAAKAVPPPVV